MCVHRTESSTSSSSDELAPPLPKRRTQFTVLHYLYRPVYSNKSHWPLIIFTLLLLLHLQPLLLFWIQRAPTILTLLGRPHMTSSFHSRSRIPFYSTLSTSPERPPSWKGLDFPNCATRGWPPPSWHQPNPFENQPHTRSQPYPYSDPFTGIFKNHKSILRM